MRTYKLKSMPYAQCEVIEEGDTIFLKSYKTIVLSLSSDGWFEVGGLYSMTTRKHISAFMREIAGWDYSIAKTAYENNYRINLDTGEIEELT